MTTFEAMESPEYCNLHVSKILVHPIKSCRGTSVESARYTNGGMEYDRRWCIIDSTTNKVITAREASKLVLINPIIKADPTSPHCGELEVSFPDESGCKTFIVPLQPSVETLSTWKLLQDLLLFEKYKLDGYVGQAMHTPLSNLPSSILSEYLKKPVHLVYKGPEPRNCRPVAEFPDLQAPVSYQDGFPLLLLSEESVEEVERKVTQFVGVQGVEERWRNDRLVIERFRPNVIIKGGPPFIEDELVSIRIGSLDHAPEISLVSPCTRCRLPNVDPETGVRDEAVPLKVMMKFRTNIHPEYKLKPCLGRNGVPSGPGIVRVGDKVNVLLAKTGRGNTAS